MNFKRTYFLNSPMIIMMEMIIIMIIMIIMIMMIMIMMTLTTMMMMMMMMMWQLQLFSQYFNEQIYADQRYILLQPSLLHLMHPSQSRYIYL